ncbi:MULTISPECIES: helix-turn-helix transcriptional regulator [unclassified Lentilitoribacter]|uniref:helix-turn-helix transcriptional regulator n=1 Tax=unclassified Lentilitoribacter TaxID=2647570 RepID=UPI0013A6D292|nr:helix-turn-helix transcriptional regulator [Lentilitoribacter sp. Alg239-R112]
MTRGQFLNELEESTNSEYIGNGLDIARRYVGAAGYLLLRYGTTEDNVVSSNWPYDLAKEFGRSIIDEYFNVGQIPERVQVFEPEFLDIENGIQVPVGYSKNVCVMPLTCGDNYYVLSFLFQENASYSYDRLRDVVFAAAYHVVEFETHSTASQHYNDLTEREMECLSWISKGKTSDEIALIIGISRNTVNNYITSIMNKTATKSRAEAVAEAVRSELI